MSANKSIYFNDLPKLVVGGLPPTTGMGRSWYPFKVSLTSGDGTPIDGTGLITGAFSDAPELVLDLGLTGWHRLYIAHNPALKVWLDGDAGYWQLPGDPSVVREISYPAADFTGRRLHLALSTEAVKQSARIFVIRAVRCDGPLANHRNLIVTNDGHGVHYHGIDTARDLYRHVASFADGDYFRMIWGLYGGCIMTMRPDTRYGETPLRSLDHCLSTGEIAFITSLQKMRDAGTDPCAVARAATREYGLELHYYLRMSAFYGPFPKVDWTTKFFTDNPGWRCRDEFGQPLNLMSYAYPGVQDRVLNFIDELVDYEPDGICLAFNRGLPLMVCEEPVIAAYRRKYGRTPKLPEEVDTPELQMIRHELLADFVARAQQVCERRGKVLSCVVPRDFERSRLFGLDADLIVKRGLVETVMVGAGHGDRHVLNDDMAPLLALKDLAHAAGVKIYGGGSNAVHGMAWVNGNLRERARRMAAYLDGGLDGGWFWDAAHVIGYEWDAMRRFGDRAVLEQILNGTLPANPNYETTAIGDHKVSRYNPWHAY